MTDIVQAIYEYTADHGLNFGAGEKINVLERGENGWWRGTLVNHDSTDGQATIEGWFPSTYVQQTAVYNSPTKDPALLPTSPSHILPLHWRATQAGDGQTYYYNELTQETSWTLPEDPSPKKTPPSTQAKRYHTISTCSNIRKPTSPKPILEEDPALLSPTSVERPGVRSNSSASNVTVDSGYNGSAFSPSPSSSRESIDAKSIGSTGSGGNRRRRKTITMNLTPTRPSFFNYPSIEESKEQSPLNQFEVSFCDNFWDDLGESSGFDIVRGHIQKGKSNCKEMADFFKERAAIEDLYAKNLYKLAHSSHGNLEKGSCGEGWQRLKKGVEDEARSHHNFSSTLLQGLEKTLSEYAERPIFIEKKDSKKGIDAVIQEDRKKVTSRFKDVEKQRVALADKQAKIGLLSKPQEISKAQKKMQAAVEDLKRSIDDYNDTQRKWIDDMILGLMELEKKESERIEFIQKKLEMYTELSKTTYEANMQAMTNTMQFAEKIDSLLDRKAFVDSSRTGFIRPVDLKK